MNSRERVIRALDRQETDRVPVGLSCGGPNSAMDALLSHFGVENGDELRRAMNIDIRGVSHWIGHWSGYRLWRNRIYEVRFRR